MRQATNWCPLGQLVIVTTLLLLVTQAYGQVLSGHSGCSGSCLLGYDHDGVPMYCGASAEPSVTDRGPIPVRTWECVPSVVRNDGSESFVVLFEPGETIVSAEIRNIVSCFGSFANNQASFRDDGIYPDSIAGDHVWTAGPFTYDISRQGGQCAVSSQNPWVTPTDPVGAALPQLGNLYKNGIPVGGSAGIWVGVLASHVPIAQYTSYGCDIQASSHVVNVVNRGSRSQAAMRLLQPQQTKSTAEIINRAYRASVDNVDQWVFFSSMRILRHDGLRNDVAGLHHTVTVDFTGTGRSSFDLSQSYGSDSILNAVNFLDAGRRGLYSGNLLHEIGHLWMCHFPLSSGLNDGTSHWAVRSNVRSNTGGRLAWSIVPGGYEIDCAVSSVDQASSIEKYLAGLSPSSSVSDLLAYDGSLPTPSNRCAAGTEFISQSEIVAHIDSSDMISILGGERSPQLSSGTTTHQIGFICESNRRVLNSTEMTFYTILAAHVERIEIGIPSQQHPRWSSIRDYYGPEMIVGSGLVLHCKPDFNRDGSVDFIDLIDFMDQWNLLLGTSCDSLDQNCDVDINCDGVVDFLDLLGYNASWSEHLGSVCP